MRVAAAGDVADLGRRPDQVLVAHQLGHGGGDFRRDGPLQALQIRFAGGVVEEVFAEFADGQALDRAKGVVVEGLEDQPADVVVVGIDERLRDNLVAGRDRQAGAWRRRARVPSVLPMPAS